MTSYSTSASPETLERLALSRRVSWGGIFAGSVIALALMILFSTIGIAIGASIVDPSGGVSLTGMSTFTIIYIVVTQLISLAVGGYAASRLAGIPRTVSAVLHGATVWALATLVGAFMATSGIGAAFNATSSLLSGAAQGTASTVEAVTPDNFSLPDISEIAGGISTDDLPEPVQEALEENNITPARLSRELQASFNDVISPQERQRAASIVAAAAQDALSTPGDIGADVNAALDELVGGENAVLSQEDLDEARATLADSLGITEEEVGQIIETVQTQFEEAVDQIRETAAALQERAVRLAENAADSLALASLILAIASVLGLAAAAAGGAAGRPDDLLA